MVTSINVTIVPGDVQCGLWCSRCALPSGLAAEIVVVTRDGVHDLGRVEWCPDCEED